MLLFVDETAFVALNSPVSPHHAQAVEYVRSLVDQTARVVTGRGVVIGTADTLKAKVGGEVALHFLKLIVEGEIKVLPTNSVINKQADRLFAEHAEDRDIRYTDCVNVALMQHYGVTKLFTFNEQIKKLQVLTVPR